MRGCAARFFGTDVWMADGGTPGQIQGSTASLTAKCGCRSQPLRPNGRSCDAEILADPSELCWVSGEIRYAGPKPNGMLTLTLTNMLVQSHIPTSKYGKSDRKAQLKN